MIYLDNAATTATRPEVVEAMLPYFTEKFGNPSSMYPLARESGAAVLRAREALAGSIGAAVYDDPEKFDVYFTSGGTEADNWAIAATAEAYADKGRHIITSAVEHHAVLHTCRYLQKRGFDVTYAGVDGDGFVRPDELAAAIRSDTILITVMTANNEIGTIQPIAEIGKIARENNILFHTDAVQAYCHIPIDVDEMNIDMMSASAHKLKGPKGVGFLYIRKGIRTKSFLHGGAQERKRRAGTENVPGIVGFGRAVELAGAEMAENARKVAALRDRLIRRVTGEIDQVVLNGSRKNRLPGNANFSVRFLESELMLLDLIGRGVCASSGSACTTKSLDPSHVLLACGISHERANGSLRMTLGEDNTAEEIDYTVDCLKEIVEKRRRLSPLYEDYIKKQAEGAQVNV
jgi:cysteine desulfurase